MQQPEPDRSLDSANDSVLVSLNDLCQAARGRCTSLFQRYLFNSVIDGPTHEMVQRFFRFWTRTGNRASSVPPARASSGPEAPDAEAAGDKNPPPGQFENRQGLGQGRQ